MAVEAHLPVILDDPAFELAAVVDSAVERAAAVAQAHGLDARAAGSVGEVLGDIDAALIATPNHTHASIAEDCLRANVHVLVEKPMTTTLEDADRVCAAAEESGCTAAAGFMLRFNRNAVRVRDSIASERFGKVRGLVYRHGTRGGWSPVSGYTMNREAIGGGSMVVLGSHLLDLVTYWLGYPDEVVLHDDARSGPEANARAELHYRERSLVAEVITSKTVAFPEGCAIDFEQGLLTFKSRGDADLTFQPYDDRSLRYTIADRETRPVPNLFAVQLADFGAAIRESRPPLVTAADGRDNVRLIDELYRHRRPIDERWYAHLGDTAGELA